MQTVNRQAARVRAKQPFVDWINSVTKVEGDSSRVDLAQVNEDCNVYLFDEFDHPDDTRSYFEDFKEEIFEAELMGWYTDPSRWPKDRTIEMFDCWFEVEFHCMVVDLETGRLKRDGPFP